jgi:hypothetical protein
LRREGFSVARCTVARFISQPRFRDAPTGLSEAQRHVGGNAVSAIERLGKDWRDASAPLAAAAQP